MQRLALPEPMREHSARREPAAWAPFQVRVQLELPAQRGEDWLGQAPSAVQQEPLPTRQGRPQQE